MRGSNDFKPCDGFVPTTGVGIKESEKSIYQIPKKRKKEPLPDLSPDQQFQKTQARVGGYDILTLKVKFRSIFTLIFFYLVSTEISVSSDTIKI